MMLRIKNYWEFCNNAIKVKDFICFSFKDSLVLLIALPIIIVDITIRPKIGKIILIFLLTIFFYFFISDRFITPLYTPGIETQKIFKVINKQYKWLTYDLFCEIYFKSKKFKLDPFLVLAVINSESYCRIYRPTISHMKFATSKSNARGLMQVIPHFHYKGNPIDVYDISLNLILGMRYLKTCLLINSSIPEAIRMYNAGINSNKSLYNNWYGYVYPIYFNYKKSCFMLKEYKKNNIFY